jgi:hypothetical protein
MAACHYAVIEHMKVSGLQASRFARAALSQVGMPAASSARPAVDPVRASDPLKDPTSSEYRELQELKQRDREVRQHEQAHVAAGGAYVRGGASFSYQRGPDGRQYATGGEVQIDTSPISGDPEATIRKMQTVQRAALAPAEPSPQDRRVAADAAQAQAEARMALRDQDDTAEGGSEKSARAVEPDENGGPTGRQAQRALAAYAGQSPGRLSDPRQSFDWIA